MALQGFFPLSFPLPVRRQLEASKSPSVREREIAPPLRRGRDSIPQHLRLYSRVERSTTRPRRPAQVANFLTNPALRDQSCILFCGGARPNS